MRDKLTMELPGLPARRGRPPTGKAMSTAERVRASRARAAAGGLERVEVQLESEVAAALRAYVARRSADAEPMTLGEAVGKILSDRLMRKR